MDTLPEPVKHFPSPVLVRGISIGLIAAAAAVAMLNDKPTGEQVRRRGPVTADFENAWRRSSHVDLMRTLNANQIDACAELVYRAHRTQPGEYLVYCSNDGRRWKVWMANTSTQSVKGPFAPDPLVALP